MIDIFITHKNHGRFQYWATRVHQDNDVQFRFSSAPRGPYGSLLLSALIDTLSELPVNEPVFIYSDLEVFAWHFNGKNFKKWWESGAKGPPPRTSGNNHAYWRQFDELFAKRPGSSVLFQKRGNGNGIDILIRELEGKIAEGSAVTSAAPKVEAAKVEAPVEEKESPAAHDDDDDVPWYK